MGVVVWDASPAGKGMLFGKKNTKTPSMDSPRNLRLMFPTWTQKGPIM